MTLVGRDTVAEGLFCFDEEGLLGWLPAVTSLKMLRLTALTEGLRRVVGRGRAELLLLVFTRKSRRWTRVELYWGVRAASSFLAVD